MAEAEQECLPVDLVDKVDVLPGGVEDLPDEVALQGVAGGLLEGGVRQGGGGCRVSE